MEITEKSLGELGETIQGASYLCGEAAAWKEASELVRQESGKMYADRKDDEAQLLRLLSMKLFQIYQTKNSTWEYASSNQTEAFAELERRQQELTPDSN